MRIADAITASAAYPPFLPPFDWVLPLSQDGIERPSRVVVTDGGVFDNLGVTVLEPGRDHKFSPISYETAIIIASDAGMGQFLGADIPSSWPGRMVQIVSAMMRKVQDAAKDRLHRHAEAGRIERFVHTHLGQIDERMPIRTAHWIPRSQVVNYPTDFSAMTEENIAGLAGRGETITRALVTRYLLSP